MKLQGIARKSRAFGWPKAYGLLAGLLLVPGLVLTAGPGAVDNAAAQDRGRGVEAEDFAAKTFRSTIVVNDNGPASPYGSTITVPELRGRVRDVNVILNRFNHERPSDVAVMLSSRGRSATLMRGAGGDTAIENANILLNDQATAPVPDDAPLVGGVAYKPFDYRPGAGYGGPAPAPNYLGDPDEALAFFNGLTPGGDWTLWVRDDAADFVGSMSGWTLEIVTDVPAGEFIAVDRYRTVQGRSLSIDAERGVLQQVDERGTPEFTARLVQRPTKGKVRLNADGSFTYVPDAGARRKDSFTYRIEDQFGSAIPGTGRVVIRIGRP